MKRTVSLGKVDYNGTGRKINQVTIEIEIKERTNLIDQNLNPIERCKVFTMSGNVWNSKHTDIITGGQICEELPKLFPHNKSLKRLVEIWGEWHLNNLKSGTHKQEDALNQWKERPEGWSYSEDCAYLNSVGLYEDNGYEYGTAWLCNPLPVEIENEINQLIKLNQDENKI